MQGEHSVLPETREGRLIEYFSVRTLWRVEGMNFQLQGYRRGPCHIPPTHQLWNHSWSETVTPTRGWKAYTKLCLPVPLRNSSPRSGPPENQFNVHPHQKFSTKILWWCRVYWSQRATHFPLLWRTVYSNICIFILSFFIFLVIFLFFNSFYSYIWI